MGVSLFVAAVYIILNLLVDVLYGVIDPRCGRSTALNATLDEAVAIGRRRSGCASPAGVRRPLDDRRPGDRRRLAAADRLRRLHRPPASAAQDSPGSSLRAAHWFGTDGLGRDVLSRVLGARVTIPLALLLVILAMTIGVPGSRPRLLRRPPRRHDHAHQRSRLRLPADHPGDGGGRRARPALRNAVLAVVIVAWPSYARRAQPRAHVPRTEFVAAAAPARVSNRRALAVEIMPNVYGPGLVLATLDSATPSSCWPG